MSHPHSSPQFWLSTKKYAHAVGHRLKSLVKPAARFARGVNGVLSFVATLLTVVGAIAIVNNFPQISGLYRKTFSPNAYWEKTLNSLTPLAQLSSFQDKLGGKPDLINQLNSHYNQDIFINDRFYVTTLVEAQSGKVLAYSVTTRKDSFKPYITRAHARLGETRFNQLNNGPFGYWDPMAYGHHYLADTSKDPSQWWEPDYYARNVYYEELYNKPSKDPLTYVYAMTGVGAGKVYGRDQLPSDIILARRGLNDVMNWWCAWDNFMGDPIVQDGMPSRPPEGMRSKPLARRNEVAINTVGFISQDTGKPSFLCDLGGKGNRNLPLFAPDFDQIKTVSQD